MADWSYVPGGGDYLYSVHSSPRYSTLMRFGRTTFKWELVKEYGSIAGTKVLWGALYAASDGTLYGTENNSGSIYKFPVALTTETPTYFTAGPISSDNDGARCIDSEPLEA